MKLEESTSTKSIKQEDNQLHVMQTRLKQSKALLASVRHEGHKKLQLPPQLRDSFDEHFSRLSQQTFKGSFLFLAVPMLLILQSVFFDIGFNNFLIAFVSSLKDGITRPFDLSGLSGVIRIYLLAGLVVSTLWLTQKQAFFQKRPQLFVSLFCAAILALMAMSFSVNEDLALNHNLELVLIYTYFFVFVLLHMQIKYLFISNLLACLLYLSCAFTFSINPDWKNLLTLVLSINLFGFMYAYLREHREIGRFLNLMEINIEKLELELLHEQIEQENELKARLTRFYSVMSGEKQLDVLAQKILGFLVPEVDAQVASLYFLENNELTLVAKHGLAQKESVRNVIQLGEGILGQAGQDKKELYLDKTPENFQVIQSGLGSVKNPKLFIMPVLFDEDLIGVIEFASIKAFSTNNLSFLRATGRSIATALKAVAAKR